MIKVNTIQTILPEIKEACSKASTLTELRSAYSSFKRRIDCLNDTQNEKARQIYFENKRRIYGKDYDFDVLPHELQGKIPTETEIEV